MTDLTSVFERLTDTQRAIATAPFVPRLVIAGAGSGKTTVMAARVVHAVTEGGMRPSEVLGLTFTNKAAGELRDRVRRALDTLYAARLIDDELADDEPTVSTYHAYSAALVRDHGLRIGREPDTTLLTEAGRWQLAMSVVTRARGPFAHLTWQPRTVAQYLLALDAEMAEHGADPATVRATDADIVAAVAAAEAAGKVTQSVLQVAESARARDELLTLVEAYRARKAELDLVDFGDQVALAAEIATAAPDVGAAERARFRAVFLDEYQDTSVAQRVLLSALFGGGHPVTAVGDPCQAIYGWRGASVGNLLRFAAHFPRADGTDDYPPDYLLTSFRNDGRVLQAANALSSPLRVRDPSSRRPHVDVPPLEPVEGREIAGQVRAAYHRTIVDEAAWVAGAVEQAITVGGTRRREVAVLCRRRSDFAVFHDALTARDIPVEVVGLGGLLEMPEVGDVVAWLEVLADPAANPALVRILTGPRYRIGPRDLAALGRRAAHLARPPRPDGDVGTDDRNGDGTDDEQGVKALGEAAAAVDPCDVVALTDAVEDPGSPDRYSPEAIERLAQLRAEISRLRPLIRQPVVEATSALVAAIGLDVELEADPDGLGTARMANLAAFLDHAAHFEGIGDDNDVPAFLDYLDAAREREDGLDIGAVSNSDTVKLLTVHKAKGLEWDVVAVPCLTKDTFPAKSRRPRWVTAAAALPTRLRGDCDDHPVDPDFTNPAIKAFRDACAADELTEERRLAYVAVTRARRLVLASGHAWNRTRSTPCPPGEFLEELATACQEGAGVVDEWCEDIGETNPVLAAGEGDVAWPVSYDAPAYAARRRTADLVRAARDGGQLPLGHSLQGEVDAVLDEIAREHAPVRTVALPRMLSASQVLRLRDDAAGFARSLARPMPRKPNPAARRGTQFHAWLEETLKARPLLDTEDLTGAADDAALPSDDELGRLRAAFAASPYSRRDPVAVEAPFALQLAGRLVRGRIDAVFRTDDGGFEVVDWKTGESGDPLQLAIYRLAWAEMARVDPSAVAATFLHIASGRVEHVTDLPDREALARLLTE